MSRHNSIIILALLLVCAALCVAEAVEQPTPQLAGVAPPSLSRKLLGILQFGRPQRRYYTPGYNRGPGYGPGGPGPYGPGYGGPGSYDGGMGGPFGGGFGVPGPYGAGGGYSSSSSSAVASAQSFGGGYSSAQAFASSSAGRKKQ